MSLLFSFVTSSDGSFCSIYFSAQLRFTHVKMGAKLACSIKWTGDREIRYQKKTIYISSSICLYLFCDKCLLFFQFYSGLRNCLSRVVSCCWVAFSHVSINVICFFKASLSSVRLPIAFWNWKWCSYLH